MRTHITVVDSSGLRAKDVLIDLTREAETEQVTHAIGNAIGEPIDGSISLKRKDGSAVTPGVPWSTNVIYDGDTLRLPASAPEMSSPDIQEQAAAVVAHLRVVGGENAGRIYQVGAGELTIGADPRCEIQVSGTGVPAVAVFAQFSEDGKATVRRAAAEATLTLNGRDLNGEQPWKPGDLLRVSNQLFELGAPEVPAAALKDSDEIGKLDYNRPPRLFPPARNSLFKFPAPPGEDQKRSLPILAALAPLVISVAIAILMQRPMFLLFGLLSPVMLFASYYSSKKSGKLSYRERLRKFRDTRRRVEEDARESLKEFEQELRTLNPDPASLGLVATTPSSRLWERRRNNPDHLFVRLGTCTVESDVVIEDPEELEHKRKVTWDAHDVPAVVPLPERGVMGICGPMEDVKNSASWVIAQLAVMQSPRDVQFHILTDRDSKLVWEWTRWLPHATPPQSDRATALVGTDAASISRRISEITAIMTERSKIRATSKDAPFEDPDIVVVLDGARRLRALPGIAQILQFGPSVGVYSVCLDEDERLLPEECHAVFSPQIDGLWVLKQQREKTVTNIVPDRVPWNWFEEVARALSPIRDASDDDDAILPNAARLLDVIGLEPPSSESVQARWSAIGRTTEAVIGVSLDGAFAIDMRKDGPHGLVAGTTGSGKSELLQTIVASLASANTPEAMNFVLVDYKGGAAFKDCVNLPHTVGMVTDLDTHLVERAMESLGAELHRREHILAAVGAKDIEDYTDLADKDPQLKPLPRLLIVIDEFASMKAELPDFVTGLVSIAQRGRSLGIHLILATQRPTGAVSADIRANTNLRISLRVTDAADSNDVLESPEAAKISKSTPGRGYVRLGATALIPFQSARVGGRRPDAKALAGPQPKALAVTWDNLGEPLTGFKTESGESKEELTDLAMLVEKIGEANNAKGYAQPHSPWLPALPDVAVLDDILAAAPERAREDHEIPPIIFGIEDLPKKQAQVPRAIDLTTFTHLYLTGSSRSGRSQALRTIAGSIAKTAEVNDVHIYGFDFGNGALTPITALPHTGAVATRVQGDRVERLVGRLSEELGARQQMLAQQGFANITEQRMNASVEERLPHAVVLLDQWEGFLSTLGDGGASPLVDRFTNLLREGAPAGIHFIVSGDKQLLSSRMSSLVEEKLVLRFSDRGDYALAGFNARKMPEKIQPGRAFAVDKGTETQIAVLVGDTNGRAQADAIKAIGAEAKERAGAHPAMHKPFKMEALPTSISLDEVLADLPESAEGLPLVVGIGGDDLQALTVDLSDGVPSFVVAGPPRSGRTTALIAMSSSLLRAGRSLVLVTPRKSALQSLAGQDGVRAVIDLSSLNVEELEARLRGDEAAEVLVIDDAELLDDREVTAWIKDYVRGASARGQAILAAGHIDEFGSGFSGWDVDLKNNRRGALLSPSSMMHGGLIGASLGKGHLSGSGPVGRAIVHTGDNQLLTVQIGKADTV